MRRRICEFFGKIGGWLEIKPTERWLASSFVEEAIRSLATSNWPAAERSVAGVRTLAKRGRNENASARCEPHGEQQAYSHFFSK